MARLGDVCTFYAGTGFPNEYQGNTSGEFPFFKVGDISKNVIAGNRKLISCDNYIDSDIVSYLRGTIVPRDTIVFAKIGEGLKLNRRAITSCDCLIDNNVIGIRANNDILDTLYFYYFMCTLDLQKYSETTAVPSVRKSRIMNIEIYLPPLDEQRKIASVLDKISDLTAKRRRQLDKLDELVKSRFIEMFGDPEKNPYGWECTVLANLMSIKPQNGLYKPQTDYVQGNNGVPILRIDAFYNGKVKDFRALKRLMCSEKEIERYELHENDIVINRVNSVEYLGKCAHIKGLVERTVFESNMMRFHLNEAFINPVYAVYLLCTNYVYNQILSKAKKAVNQASINQNDVMSIKLLIPPVAQQKQFANFYITTDRLQSMIKRSFTALEMLKKSLMQEYFSLR